MSKVLHILVAEDHPINRMVFEAAVVALGHSCLAVSNGREAVEAASHGDFDGIFLDIEMPEMDGRKAVAAIRALPNGAQAKIYALSGHAPQSLADTAPHFDGFLAKPVMPGALAEALARITPGRPPKDGFEG